MMYAYIFICAIILRTIMSSPKFVPVVTSYSNGLKSEDTRLNLSNQSNKGYVIKTITSAPLYRIVSYFTNLTEEGEAKVHDLDIPHSMYYTHIYLAWKSADQLMSSITLQADDSESKLNGANLVLSTSKLGDMYAPGRITSVLDFVTKCYEWAKPNTPPIPSSSAFISTLRVSATNEINRALIKYTAEQFLRATTHGSYHYVWERNSKMKKFMEKLNYEQVICGGTESFYNPCDWTLMGLEPKKAKEQCLYRLINKKSNIY
uniref:N-acetyltransferase domain-containing protein n=2 Tax=Schistosoma mansoni TaxID=6183 RepID=A0A5K4F2M1_SCHMA